MPIHFASLRSNSSRRTFLRTIAATGGVAVFASMDPAHATESDADYFALLSDTHIPERPDITAHGVNMTENLQQVIRQLTQSAIRPAQLLINGDCAYLKGLPADYVNLASCLQPLDSLGIDLHLTMGNHDDRQPLYDALIKVRPTATGVLSKHISVLETQHANWFLLDSLFKVNLVTGELGDTQLEWLGNELAARADKPAIVMVHHNPQFEPPATNKPWTGLSDTEKLFDLLAVHSHVKAVFYGHSHHWNYERRGDLQLVNLPPVAYVFSEGQPNGWVDAKSSEDGLQLTLRTLDAKHPRSGEVVKILW